MGKYLSLFSACGFVVLGKRLHFFPFALGNCLSWPSPVLLRDETLRACERAPRGGRQSGPAFPRGSSFSVVLWPAAVISRTILYMLEPKPLSRPAACSLVPFLASFARAAGDAAGSIPGQDVGLCWQEHHEWEQTPCVARGCLLSLGYLHPLPSFQAGNLLSV